MGDYKERALYSYECVDCNETRQTVKENRAVEGVCTKCKRQAIPDNQTSIFDEIDTSL